MRRSIKSAIALLAVSALPLVAVAPAGAVAFDRLNFTVDCLLGETGPEADHVLASGETLTISLVNCAGYQIAEFDGTGNARLTTVGLLTSDRVTIPAGVVTLTIAGEADIDFEDDNSLSTDPDFDIDIEVYVANVGIDPNSTLLATEEVTLELTSPETMIREEMIGDPEGDDDTGDIYMGGLETCQVEPGLHVYTTLEFTVLVDGTYDFRAVGVSPLDEDLNWGVPKYPSSDPFVAVYDNFDPSAPEANIVGCNDDGYNTGFDLLDDQWENESEAIVTPAGIILHEQWPWFRADLEPGTYALVYMPFSAVGTADFARGRFDVSSDNFDVTWDATPQSVIYEMWGPTGGLTLGALANTGVNPALALWSGVALAGTGVAISVARRRAVRA